MNIQNHILPATIAAALHVALLWGIPKYPPPPITGTIEIPLPPLPKPPDERVVLPPDDPGQTPPEVRPLAGGPQPPELPEPPVKAKVDDFIVPENERLKPFTPNAPVVPKTFGPGDSESANTGPVGPPMIFSPGQLDRVPRATVQAPPVYPSTMHQQGLSGSVTVEFLVDPQGRVVRAEAIHYRHREFVDPAVRAVLQWHFEPGRRNGRPVPFRMAVPIEFTLPAT